MHYVGKEWVGAKWNKMSLNQNNGPSFQGPHKSPGGLDTQGREGNGKADPGPWAARVFPPKHFLRLGEVNLLMSSNLLPSVREPSVLIKNCGQL